MKKLSLFTCLILVFLLLAAPVSAAGDVTFELDKDSCTAGEYIRLTAAYNGDAEPGALLAELSYDPAQLRYVRTEGGDSDYIRSADFTGLTRTIYTAGDGKKGELFVLVYKVLPGATDAEIQTDISGIVDRAGNSLCDDMSITVSAEVMVPSEDALLLDLVPSSGEFEEDFSPYTKEYNISVPYEVESMSFEATVSKGASCSINRKNLGSGGSVTDFLITVRSEDGSTENVYTVKVKRGEYVRPAAEVSETDPTDPQPVPKDETDESFETLTPEYAGEEGDEVIMNSRTDSQVVVTPHKSGETVIRSGSMGYFLAGAGACLVCVFAGVLIALLLSGKGKHGKH